MDSLSRAVFYKQPTCPSSETLLAFHHSALTTKQRLWTAAHVGACDFCGAELQLLKKCSAITEDERPPANMPLHLRQLAEAILGANAHTVQSLPVTIYEKERLTLTDA